jgi:galactose mutarotase-like enzyme
MTCSKCNAESTGSPLINGVPAVTLKRAKTGDGAKPEFLSAVVLPGSAMNLFQITAWVPGKGEISLLSGPSLEEAAKIIGSADDPVGSKTFTFGGAFLLPFSNRIVDKLSADKKTVTFSWNGVSQTLPANHRGVLPGAIQHAIHGLILQSKADELTVNDKGDKQSVTGVIHGGDFCGRWFSKSDVTISISLDGDAVIATAVVKNVGDKAEPVGIAFHPYFIYPSGKRAQVRLHVQGDLVSEVNNYDDVFITGKLVPVKGTPYDFTAKGGAPLGELFLDDNWTNLKKDAEGHSYSEIIDPAAKYGLRIHALSSHINTVQVYSPLDKDFVALEPQFNLNDPFSEKWGDADRGMVKIEPGESVTWKVKLELFIP